MARKNWIKGAIPEAHQGVLKAKAAAAGESTQGFAEKHKVDRDRTGAQSRLALTLLGMNGGGRRMKYKSAGK